MHARSLCWPNQNKISGKRASVRTRMHADDHTTIPNPSGDPARDPEHTPKNSEMPDMETMVQYMQATWSAAAQSFTSPESYVQEAIFDALLHSALCIVWFYAYNHFLILPFLKPGDNKTRRLAFVSDLFLAIVGSVAGTVQCLRVLEVGWTLEAVMGSPREWRCIMHFFMAGFVWDWILSLKYYPDQFDLLTGYVHHVFYFGIGVGLLYFQCTSAFATCLVFEYSGCIGSLGLCHPSLRSDWAFGASFFVFRILYHIYAVCQFFMMGHPIWMLAALPLLMHFYWFNGWCRKYLFGGERKSSKQLDTTRLSDEHQDLANDSDKAKSQ